MTRTLPQIANELVVLYQDARESLAATTDRLERAALKTVATGLQIAMNGASVTERCPACAGPDPVLCRHCGALACAKCQFEVHFPQAMESEAAHGAWACPKAPPPCTHPTTLPTADGLRHCGDCDAYLPPLPEEESDIEW